MLPLAVFWGVGLIFALFVASFMRRFDPGRSPTPPHHAIFSGCRIGWRRTHGKSGAVAVFPRWKKQLSGLSMLLARVPQYRGEKAYRAIAEACPWSLRFLGPYGDGRANPTLVVCLGLRLGVRGVDGMGLARMRDRSGFVLVGLWEPTLQHVWIVAARDNCSVVVHHGSLPVQQPRQSRHPNPTPIAIANYAAPNSSTQCPSTKGKTARPPAAQLDKQPSVLEVLFQS